MRRLILMRHAKSDWSFGSSDLERPLNKRGQASASALGDWLRVHSYLPDEVLCSSATRTAQTLLGLKLTQGIPTQFLTSLYLAEAAEMLHELKSATGTSVLMLGHNPGICEFAHRLVNDPPDHIRFEDYPTGATTIIDFEIGTWGDVEWYQGTPTEFVIPREL